jgi:hypothetical protein
MAAPVVPAPPNYWGRLTKTCAQYERLMKGLEMYLMMQKSLKFSPEMKVTSLGEKIGLALIIINQAIQYHLDDEMPSDPNAPPIPDRLESRLEKLRKSVDVVFSDLADDLVGSIAQLGSPESMIGRVDQKLDAVLHSPNVPSGLALMRQAEVNFHTVAPTVSPGGAGKPFTCEIVCQSETQTS